MKLIEFRMNRIFSSCQMSLTAEVEVYSCMENLNLVVLKSQTDQEGRWVTLDGQLDNQKGIIMNILYMLLMCHLQTFKLLL